MGSGLHLAAFEFGKVDSDWHPPRATCFEWGFVFCVFVREGKAGKGDGCLRNCLGEFGFWVGVFHGLPSTS